MELSSESALFVFIFTSDTERSKAIMISTILDNNKKSTGIQMDVKRSKRHEMTALFFNTNQETE